MTRKATAPTWKDLPHEYREFVCGVLAAEASMQTTLSRLGARDEREIRRHDAKALRLAIAALKLAARKSGKQ